MIYPMLRLVFIYVAVVLAVLAVFNRDKVSQLVFGTEPAAVESTEMSGSDGESEADSVQAESQVTPVVTDDTDNADHATSQAAAPASGTEPTDQAQDVQNSQHPTPQTSATMPRTAGTPAPMTSPMAPQAPMTAAESQDLATQLNKARNAYRVGNLEEAEAVLTALAQDNADNPDVFGELGNLQLAQNKRPEAAEAYFRAGELLLQQNRYPQLLPLLSTLRMIAPDKAVELQNKMNRN